MVLVKASADSESGRIPNASELAEMGQFNDELVKAGVMLAGDGLQATSKGARITFSGGKPQVTDGPFTETKELIAGFWIVQAKSKEEAVEWFSRAPFEEGQLEIRQLFEMEDFTDLTPELRAKEERQRAEMAQK